jgi:hypothetical protein
MEVGTSSVLMLPYTASSVGVARRRLIGDLSEAGVFEATACDAGLVISELISNALRHATPLPGSVVRVAWWLDDDCLEIAVSDGGGPTLPVVNEPGLALRWGVCSSPDDARETTVWAEFALSPDKADEHSDAGSSADHRPRRLVITSSRDA